MGVISDVLRQAIEESGMTRSRISQETGVDESVLSRFMAGANLTMRHADTLAEFLGLELRRKGRSKTRRKSTK